MASGLEEPANCELYGRQLETHSSARIENRPHAQEALRYLQTTISPDISAPFLFPQVPEGVCCQALGNSRYNLPTIAATWWSVENCLENCPSSSPEDRTIIILYQADVKGFEKSAIVASKQEFSQTRDIRQI